MGKYAWNTTEILPSSAQYASAMKGRTLGILLAIELKGTRTNYMFVFQVDAGE
jgi:hypothetical protein